MRVRGYSLSLKLVGDCYNVYMDIVDAVIQECDMEWIELLCHDPAVLPELLSQSNVFIFASSCENMPSSLVEATANVCQLLARTGGWCRRFFVMAGY